MCQSFYETWNSDLEVVSEYVEGFQLHMAKADCIYVAHHLHWFFGLENRTLLQLCFGEW